MSNINQGEIDIVEGVNNQGTNQYTLHTSSGCSLDNQVTATAKSLSHTSCESSGTDNSGCAFKDTTSSSYGQGFNAAQGGVFAHQWDTTGIIIWHFTRDAIPADITSGNPDPSTWPTPAAQFSSTSCPIEEHFYNHTLTIDTTLCGDWAGSAYASSGCPGTCEEAVADPSNFSGKLYPLGG